MTHIQSHYFEGQAPFLLEEHLSRVRLAADFLLKQHHIPSQYPQTEQLLKAIVDCHDLGKGSAGFQEYIKNPKKYEKDKEEKAHTALSAALAILWAKQQNWEVLDILALTQAIAGHHSGFRALSQGKETTLDFYLRSDNNVLDKQWQTINLQQLSQATGLHLEDIIAEFEDAHEWLFDELEIKDKLKELTLTDAIIFRLWTQFLFSILLEADKALLALNQSSAQRYFEKISPSLPPDKVPQYIARLPFVQFAHLRQTVRQQIVDNIYKNVQERCFTLTLPTGLGKTLLAATWALEQRQFMQKSEITPKIIVVLPFLSIIDQTEKIYRQLLDASPQQSELLMSSHSLAQRQWDSESDQNSSAFFLNTWHSDIVITTFDQFLLALFSPKTKYLMRFHHLMDALIILDEVQTIPVKLWDLMNHTLQNLVQLGCSKVLLMSATQPDLLQPAIELLGNKPEIEQIFTQCNRYRIIFKHQESQLLDDFIEELIPRVATWIENKQRPLITLNTRDSAKSVWHALQEARFGEKVPVYLISADLIQRDRLRKIEAIDEAIKAEKLCIVVSTQTVEAGVDIDMDVVIRDFAPLDALIQIAGRCNRNLKKGEYGGYVEIVSLQSKNKKDYAKFIYDPVILDVTRNTLTKTKEVAESNVLPLVKEYFSLLKERKNRGEGLTKSFARWETMEDVHRILRPTSGEKIEFLVIDDDEGQELIKQLHSALQIKDRWDKRRKLQALAGDLNKRTVAIYKSYKDKKFDPEECIDSNYLDLYQNHGYAILKTKYYDVNEGIKLVLDETDTATAVRII